MPPQRNDPGIGQEWQVELLDLIEQFYLPPLANPAGADSVQPGSTSMPKGTYRRPGGTIPNSNISCLIWNLIFEILDGSYFLDSDDHLRPRFPHSGRPVRAGHHAPHPGRHRPGLADDHPHFSLRGSLPLPLPRRVPPGAPPGPAFSPDPPTLVRPAQGFERRGFNEPGQAGSGSPGSQSPGRVGFSHAFPDGKPAGAARQCPGRISFADCRHRSRPAIVQPGVLHLDHGGTGRRRGQGFAAGRRSGSCLPRAGRCHWQPSLPGQHHGQGNSAAGVCRFRRPFRLAWSACCLFVPTSGCTARSR